MAHQAVMLRELLALIHRDGGHYVASHGIERACEEAALLVAGWLALADRSVSSSGAGDAPVETGWIAVEDRLPEPSLICDWAFPATDPKCETWVLCGEAMLTASVPGRAAYWRLAQPMFPGSSPIKQEIPEALSEEQIDALASQHWRQSIYAGRDGQDFDHREFARAIERAVIAQKGKGERE